MRKYCRLGMVLLGIWLVLTGLASLVSLVIPDVVMGVLALVAGIFFVWPGCWFDG